MVTAASLTGSKLTDGLANRGLPLVDDLGHPIAHVGEQCNLDLLINRYGMGMHNPLRHAPSASVTVSSVHISVTATALTPATAARVRLEPDRSLPRFDKPDRDVRLGTPAKPSRRPVVGASNDAAAALALPADRDADDVGPSYWRGAGATGDCMLPRQGVRTIGIDRGVILLVTAAAALTPRSDGGKRQFEIFRLSSREYKHVRFSAKTHAQLARLDAPIATPLALVADAPRFPTTAASALATLTAVSTYGVTVVRHRLKKAYQRVAHAAVIRKRIALARPLGDMRRGTLINRSRNMPVRTRARARARAHGVVAARRRAPRSRRLHRARATPAQTIVFEGDANFKARGVPTVALRRAIVACFGPANVIRGKSTIAAAARARRKDAFII